MDVTVKTERKPKDALFMSEVWLSGQAEDGTEVSLDRTMGSSIILRIKFPDGEEITEVASMGALMQEWANGVERERQASHGGTA